MAKKKTVQNKKSGTTIEIKKKKIDLINYKKNYKKLIIIPVIMFILAIFSIIQTVSHEGTPIYRDVTLKGGLSAIINTNSVIATSEFESALKQNFKDNSFSMSELNDQGKRVGFIVDTDLKEEDLINFIEKYFKETFTIGDNYSSNFISPTLSNSFFIQAIYILLISFFTMSVIIFLYFRKLVPSGAVVLSGIFDIIITIGILDYMNFKISIAGIGALLMIIGYSIDTDVLLTNRLIKEKGDNYFEKAFDAFKTGTVMSSTTLIAGIAALFITNSAIIYEISLILVIGLLVDFVSTWIQNTSLLLWWLDAK